MEHYSVSSLQLHQKNPRRWCLKYLLGWKEAETEALRFGKEFHEFVAGLILEAPKPTLLQPEDRALCKQWYDDWKFSTEGKNKTWNVEQPFRINLVEGLPSFIGTIDLWTRDVKNDRTVVLDHKTCNPKYMETAYSLLSNWQLALYSYVLNGGQTDTLIGHNQFIKGKKSLSSFKEIRNILTKNKQREIIERIKTEAYEAKQTEQVFKESGIGAIRKTPENKFWYGKEDPWWPVLNEEMSINKFKEERGWLI